MRTASAAKYFRALLPKSAWHFTWAASALASTPSPFAASTCWSFATVREGEDRVDLAAGIARQRLRLQRLLALRERRGAAELEDLRVALVAERDAALRPRLAVRREARVRLREAERDVGRVDERVGVDLRGAHRERRLPVRGHLAAVRARDLDGEEARAFRRLRPAALHQARRPRPGRTPGRTRSRRCCPPSSSTRCSVPPDRSRRSRRRTVRAGSRAARRPRRPRRQRSPGRSRCPDTSRAIAGGASSAPASPSDTRWARMVDLRRSGW